MALQRILNSSQKLIKQNIKFDIFRAEIHSLKKIGKREIVGYGWNGTACYIDHVSYPMPGIRYKEPSNESICLNAKEQLDWRKLSMVEKRALYRYSFCQTFSELKAGTGEWKMHLGFVLMAISLGIWVTIFNHKYLYDKLPVSFDEEHQKAQLKRMLTLEINPVQGISSKWDYEKKKWK
ncbi:cytochrome c oxidase subunit 4 isoform 1, mitochondrial-like [Episyrphus balteatus]|uniref:cytochrome c oxidase subunit 4 isoform 1, mitochondrial-like n=1 Tax=Episyrphus balteatus TaxID=286459 RepID=UPI002485CB70|nr:cytochrome c oxidase subunit 4 isoform 1, mitochondrial-like [Episyrphus balteatus]